MLALEIEFATKQLYDCALDRRAGVRKWGPPIADAYLLRLRQLQAADSQATIRALRQLRLHKLVGRADWYAINLHDRWRLIVSFHDAVITILEVSNHYDD